MKNLIYSLLALFFITCTNSNTDSGNNTEVENNDPPEEVVLFKALNEPTYDLANLDYEGEITDQRFWQDANGENIVLFTQKEEELFVYHFAVESGKATQLRKVYDFVKDCEFDRTLEFIPEAITVTDLDKNNLGEITFAYRLACISDVSPLDLKLLVLENGEKFIMRGTTTIEMGEETYGGSKDIDPSFEKAPAPFLSHANNVWSEIQ